MGTVMSDEKKVVKSSSRHFFRGENCRHFWKGLDTKGGIVVTGFENSRYLLRVICGGENSRLGGREKSSWRICAHVEEQHDNCKPFGGPPTQPSTQDPEPQDPEPMPPGPPRVSRGTSWYIFRSLCR